MKVSELYIKKYHQFEDFKLNLTYPQGHKFAGKPLNKVCFIGQSGTGKTTLLELLKEFIKGTTDFFNMGNIQSMALDLPKNYGSLVCLEILYENKEVEIIFDNTSMSELSEYYVLIDEPIDTEFYILYPNFKLFNYPSDIELPKEGKKSKNNESQSANEYIDQIPQRAGRIERKKESIRELNVIDFEDYDINQIWQTINEAIIEDRELEIKKSLEISKILRNPKVLKDVLDKATDEFRKWREETPNPIQDLADNYLDKIIGRFNLKVKTELDFEKKEDIETIKIQQKNGKEIPFEALSTGTKQVILTALPLYGLKPKDSIILFDEPERSLYPDIQTEIVDFYTSMAENSQFFFATHSPLVAASFEPWEIIELKFNEETGNVEQELYYDIEKGRHVDNYTIYPQYLTYDGILKRVFDMKKEPNSLRMNELVKLATLESQLKHNNLSPEAKKEKFEEIIKLADQLDWDLK